MLLRLVCMLVGYLCGCVLTAELVSRQKTKRSIFNLGDGNPGMANVGRELGKPAAIFCLLGDILKTLLPVLLMSRVFGQLEWAVVAGWTGLGATIGHIWPFWHRFCGGKGVTTIASTIILMNPLWGIIAGLVGVGTIIVSGYLCVAAVVAMLFYTLCTAITLPPDCALISVFFTALQVLTHWTKLQGIRRGTTQRAGLSKRFWSLFRR